MNDLVTKPKTKAQAKTERPKLYKVILINDDYTPREFVVTVLKAVFRMTEDQAYKVMITAHRRGVHQGRRRDQGDRGNRFRQERRLSLDVHDRAGGVGA